MNVRTTKTRGSVYVSECKENDVTYGVISIKLKPAYQNLTEAEALLQAFLRHLQPAFGIRHTHGAYASEHQTCKIALIDYWQDVERTDWKVKGWTNGSIMAVLYIKNISNLSVYKEEYFLNGTLFTR